MAVKSYHDIEVSYWPILIITDNFLMTFPFMVIFKGPIS